MWTTLLFIYRNTELQYTNDNGKGHPKTTLFSPYAVHADRQWKFPHFLFTGGKYSHFNDCSNGDLINNVSHYTVACSQKADIADQRRRSLLGYSTVHGTPHQLSNSYATIEELWEVVFSDWSMQRLRLENRNSSRE